MREFEDEIETEWLAQVTPEALAKVEIAKAGIGTVNVRVRALVAWSASFDSVPASRYARGEEWWVPPSALLRRWTDQDEALLIAGRTRPLVRDALGSRLAELEVAASVAEFTPNVVRLDTGSFVRLLTLAEKGKELGDYLAGRHGVPPAPPIYKGAGR